jgi:hypothetical protein
MLFLFAISKFVSEGSSRFRVFVRGRDRDCSLIKFFYHRQTKSIQRIGRFMILSTLVVTQEGKDQAPSAGCFRETGKRSDVFDRSGLRVDSSNGQCAFHAVLQRAVDARHRQ